MPIRKRIRVLNEQQKIARNERARLYRQRPEVKAKMKAYRKKRKNELRLASPYEYRKKKREEWKKYSEKRNAKKREKRSGKARQRKPVTFDDSRNTTLYRHFDENGGLLYIGISLSVTTRLFQHSQSSQWFKDIKYIELEHFEDRKSALQAEELAIRSESPKFNKTLRADNDNLPNQVVKAA